MKEGETVIGACCLIFTNANLPKRISADSAAGLPGITCTIVMWAVPDERQNEGISRRLMRAVFEAVKHKAFDALPTEDGGEARPRRVEKLVVLSEDPWENKKDGKSWNYWRVKGGFRNADVRPSTPPCGLSPPDPALLLPRPRQVCKTVEETVKLLSGVQHSAFYSPWPPEPNGMNILVLNRKQVETNLRCESSSTAAGEVYLRRRALFDRFKGWQEPPKPKPVSPTSGSPSSSGPSASSVSAALRAGEKCVMQRFPKMGEYFCGEAGMSEAFNKEGWDNVRGGHLDSAAQRGSLPLEYCLGTRVRCITTPTAASPPKGTAQPSGSAGTKSVGGWGPPSTLRSARSVRSLSKRP